MKGIDAREIIEEMKEEGKTVQFVGDYLEVKLIGIYTVEQLSAILHVMEYDD